MAQCKLICNFAGKRDFFTPSLLRRSVRGILQSQLTLVDIRRTPAEVSRTAFGSEKHFSQLFRSPPQRD